ncbi:hypothetical protein HHI36_022395, partial [Cryptolaemus montrouzieri]
FSQSKRNRNKPVRENGINVNEVLTTVNGNPHVSTVTISAATNISPASVKRNLWSLRQLRFISIRISE